MDNQQSKFGSGAFRRPWTCYWEWSRVHLSFSIYEWGLGFAAARYRVEVWLGCFSLRVYLPVSRG